MPEAALSPIDPSTAATWSQRIRDLKIEVASAVQSMKAADGTNDPRYASAAKARAQIEHQRDLFVREVVLGLVQTEPDDVQRFVRRYMNDCISGFGGWQSEWWDTEQELGN